MTEVLKGIQRPVEIGIILISPACSGQKDVANLELSIRRVRGAGVIINDFLIGLDRLVHLLDRPRLHWDVFLLAGPHVPPDCETCQQADWRGLESRQLNKLGEG